MDKHDKRDPKTKTIHFPSLLIIRFLKGFSQSVMTPSDHFPSLHHLGHPQPDEFDGRFHYIPVDHKGQYKGMARCSEVATRTKRKVQNATEPCCFMFFLVMSQHMFMIFHNLQFHVVDMVRIYNIYQMCVHMTNHDRVSSVSVVSYYIILYTLCYNYCLFS